MAELNQEKLEKRRKTNKKILSIFGIIFGVLIIIVIIGGIMGGEGEKTAAIEQIREKLENMGYVEKKEDNLSYFRIKEGEKIYSCNLYNEQTLKGNVTLTIQNMSEPAANDMWRVVKDITLNNTKLKDTLLLYFALTDNEISLDDVLNGLDNYTKSNKPPISTGTYLLPIDKEKHYLRLKANWHSGTTILEYRFNMN